MKRTILLLAAILCAGLLAAEDAAKIGFVTDGYIIANAESGTATAGQDVNVAAGPFTLVLTADWTETLWGGADILAVTYAAGFSKAFGMFTPSIKLTGDQTYALDKLSVQSGDYISDLTPTLNIALGAAGLDLYSDLSFEKDYKIFQTFDGSAYLTFKLGSVRAGILYMDAQAMTDDVGHPNGPTAKEGMNFYAKASIAY